ncbi:MAG: hypothetical protein ACYTGH_07250 [Planctomycetota bacterium]|jgi:hypothetical protein
MKALTPGILLFVLALPLQAAAIEFTPPTPDQFKAQWYDQGAEVSHYHLRQVRYGEVHEGRAVLIFVTEPFHPDTQVKADRPDADSIPMLKLNLTRSFLTGLYPYSTMTSVFSPVDAKALPLPTKITFSSQEWCGQVFMQFNRTETGYRTLSRSYFETEGDREETLPTALPEDGIWNRIRLAPGSLPIGEVSLLPSAFHIRLVHRPPTARTVTATLRALPSGRVVYSLIDPTEERRVTWVFEKAFPHRIAEWREEAGDLRTTMTLKKRIMIDYWNRNRNQDRALRKELALPTAE